MTDDRPSGPYRDHDPDYWAKETLPHGVRGQGSVSNISDGDQHFHSGRWKTIHGPVTIVRWDRGAIYIWEALLEDGRRLYCERSFRDGWGTSHWRRRSDDGRSWVLGKVIIKPDDVFFTDGVGMRSQPKLDQNDFEIAMASQPDFIRELQDDAVALTLNTFLRDAGVCTFDESKRWSPSFGEIAGTIADLRGFGETYLDFKFRDLPDELRCSEQLIEQLLANAGWRFMTPDEERRFEEEERDRIRRSRS